ncbi:class I SAM-dependent methyltransferase [Leptolyngbya sp. FACHB-261]|uniref:class I SAM-dependent methyltransferase n=1 Tax=Leptolyngbya sp. FACHB-261 TaxID=2692806 RepID=UPI001688DA0F|nr:class I SAM-dependent methyltransferase [Leptolyngbya sp. FACHB-261]MBD2103581.1 class I SAM-dependent methyltransferase [Leptolyngbya sp. FACHB-261]
MVNQWTQAEHALGYLSRAEQLPHRLEGEAVLLEQIPRNVERVLDLGTGDGRLLALVKRKCPHTKGVALDFSPAMLQAAQARFADDATVEIVAHDFDQPLPPLGCFDVVVSSFAIHHCPHERKRSLYEEIFDLLEPGGVFCNLEHVASPTPALHERFLYAIGQSPHTDDPSNKLLDVETQLGWLRQVGFADVDCYWKWLELALLVGVKPA